MNWWKKIILMKKNLDNHFGINFFMEIIKIVEYDEIEAEACSLEPGPGNIRHCLSTLSGKDIQEIQSKKLGQIFNVKGAKNQAERIEKVRSWLESHQPFSCGGGISFDIAPDILEIKSGNEAGEVD